MCKHKHVLLLLLFMCGTFSDLVSQISVVPSSGCMPLGITNALFTYTGPGALTDVAWDYGDGTPTNTLTQTQHSYPNQGNFVAKLNAKVNGVAVTYTAGVNVYPQPNGSFTQVVPPIRCTPLSVFFNATSTANNALYSWSFGDLGSGSGSSTTYAYNSQGSFTPALTIQDTQTGCYKIVKGPVIAVSNLPTIVISSSNGYFSCAPSLATFLNGSSSSAHSPIQGGQLTYNWNMGAFGTSSQPITNNTTFSPVGIHPVVLTVTDNNNCQNSATVTIELRSPTISITVPATVCIQNQMPFSPPFFVASVSSSEPSTTWDMGDGTIKPFPTPIPPFPATVLIPNTVYTHTIHAYTTPGLKTVTAKAITGPCVATQSATIMVEEIIPNFVSVPPSVGCNPTFTAAYTNSTTINTNNPLSYTWTLADWTGVTTQSLYVVNPSFVVTQTATSPYVNYTHPPYFLHPYMFVSSSPMGCIDVIDQYFDTLQRPTAIFEVDKAEGCVPLTVMFTNSSLTHSTNLQTSATWSFGVSNASTLTTTSPITNSITSFTYTNPGTYYPTLSIMTASGCGHTSYQHTITVASPPTISISVTPSVVCAGLTQAQFHFSTAATSTVQHWHLEGGDFSHCVTDKDPNGTFTHPGVYDFTVSAYQFGCKSTSVFPSSITVKGPGAKLMFQTNCTVNRSSVKFYYTLEDALTGSINYGDGSGNFPLTGAANATVNGTATHTFVPGTYTVTLTGINGVNGCNSPTTKTVQVTVTGLTANFILPLPVICKNAFLPLNGGSSVGVFTNSTRGYTWFVDSFPPMQTSSTTYTATNPFFKVGIHTVKLVVKDVNACLDSVRKSFRVSSPAPNFTFNANPICMSGMPLHIIDLTPQLPDPISNYQYNMGDSTLFAPATPTSTRIAGPSPYYTYPTIGGRETYTFGIVLTATNNLGCRNTKTVTITVNDPVINVATNSFMGCAPQLKTFSFTAVNTHTRYVVNYGAGPSSSITTFTNNSVYTTGYTYLTAGSYTPVFTVTDFGGCSKTTTIGPIEIQVAPVASFTFFDVNTGVANGTEYCIVLNPKLTSTSQSPYTLGYDWTIGPYNLYTLNSTANMPLEGAGDYTLSLIAKTIPSGCSSTYSVKVTLYKPEIDFKIIPNDNVITYCLGQPITFSVTTRVNVPGFQWDFGNGVPTNTILSTIYHKIDHANTYFPENTNGLLTVALTGYSGAPTIDCRAVRYRTLLIKRVLPAFLRNNEILALDSIHCIGKQEFFKNQSTTNILAPLTYTWSLGDGRTETTTDVTHTYLSPGTYTVKLQVVEPIYNCKADLSKKMVINPLPRASTFLEPFSCPATPFTINGTGSPGVSGMLTGTILPGPLFVNFANTFSVSSSASVSTTYSLHVMDNNGCEKSAPTASIFIQPYAPKVNWDTTVIIGSPAPLNAFAGSGFTYTWTPLVTDLNCTTCVVYNPVSTTTNNITYSVMVQDEHLCAIVKNTYHVNVEIKVSIDVPTAFTPNGDGINDVIFPDGWGLRKLNYFKIFNRWGQLVFESNDLSIGWDGVFQGAPQNIETYVYQVSAETYLDKQPTLTKSGTFKLLR